MGDSNSSPHGSAFNIDEFLALHTGIKAVRPSDPDFEAKAETWVYLERVGWPLIAVRPQSEDDVSALIGHFSSNRIPFAVRSGGHDLSARSKAAGGVQVDMRDMAHVRVSKDRKTARVGGGILNIDLLKKLEGEGLVTPVATNGIVGYAGWCGLGGYGPWSAVYGLGCDQIVGARVVLWDGRVVDADQKLLKGIRGAGPAFGVIAEFEIKVYPIEETQGGLIIYTGGGLSLEDTIKKWYVSFVANPLGPNNLPPPQLQLQPQVFGVGIPGQERSLAIKVTWIGPKSEDWEATLAKLQTFAPGATSQMTTMSPVELVRSWDEVIPARVYGGGVKTVSLRLLPCPETIDIMAGHASKKPDEGMWMCHMYHDPVGRDAPTALPSVFKIREPHSMVEIVGFATHPGPTADELLKWAGDFEKAAGASPDALDGRYYSLTAEEDVKVESVFGEEELLFLLELKREYDPHNFFRAIPLV